MRMKIIGLMLELILVGNIPFVVSRFRVVHDVMGVLEEHRTALP